MNKYGWVFAGLFQVTLVACIYLAYQVNAPALNGESYLDVALYRYGGFTGGIIAAIGTVYAGYLAFVATSESTKENTKQAYKVANNERAIELRDYISWHASFMAVLKIQHDIFRQMMNSPHSRVWRESIEIYKEQNKSVPNWRLIYPIEIERMISAVQAKVSAAIMMMGELSPSRGLMTPKQFDEEIGKYLAYNIDHVSLRLAEAKSYLLILNQVAHKYRNLDVDFEGVGIPDKTFFDEIADEFQVDRGSLHKQIFGSGVEIGNKYQI